MPHKVVLCLVALICLIPKSFAQQPVAPENLHERVWAVVPMIGTGTAEDPKRPAYVPAPPPPGKEPAPSAFLGFASVISDDGKTALVEFVARDKSFFKDLLADTRPSVKVFVKGQATRADVETEFRKVKSTFSLEQLRVIVP